MQLFYKEDTREIVKLKQLFSCGGRRGRKPVLITNCNDFLRNTFALLHFCHTFSEIAFFKT